MRTGCGGRWAGLSEAPQRLARAGLAARSRPFLWGCLHSARQGVQSPRPADRPQNAPSGPNPHGLISSDPRGSSGLPVRRTKSCPSPSSESLSPPSFSSQIFALLTENRTRTQLGPLRAPVRRLHSVCRLRILSSHPPAGPLPSRRPHRGSTPQSGLKTSLHQRPGSSDCRAPAAAALPSCSLQSRGIPSTALPSSHTRAQWGLSASPFPGLAAWAEERCFK